MLTQSQPVALQALQSNGTWYTIKTFNNANEAWIYLGKVSRRYRVVKL